MATLGFGLRAKSILALVLACLFAVTTAGLIGWRILEGVRNHFGEAYARNLTQLKRERILAPISRDLALAKRLANSEITRQWLASENDAALRALFFKEAEAYRHDLSSRSYFLCSNRSRGFYFNDDNKVSSDQPRYIFICDIWSPRLSPQERSAIAGVIAATDVFNGTVPSSRL